jgi:hypothetical protein
MRMPADIRHTAGLISEVDEADDSARIVTPIRR